MLPKYFGDDDPGAFIAQFLAMFYQVQEHEPGRHEGGNWAAGLKFKLITIRNPGWREFVEENLIESLFALETMHWLNDINVTDNQASYLIKELADIHAAIEGKLNVVDASALPGQMLVQRYVLKHIFWMRQVREAKKAEEKNASEEGEIDAVEDDVEVAEEDEETAENNRNLAKIQGLADALPLVKGIVFGGAEMGHYLPGPFSDEFKFSDAPRLLPLLPQAMFERVVYWASESREQLYDVDQFFYSGIAAFLNIIMSWPMAGEALSWGDFDHHEFRQKICGETIQDVVPFDKVPHMTIYLLGRLFSTLFWLDPGIIVEAARQSNGNVFSPPEFSIQRLGYLIERAIERIAHARRITHTGLSPVSIDSAAEIGFCLSEICPLLKLAPKHDLSYLLAAPPDWADDFGSFAGDVNKQDTSEETQRYAQDRAANYMRVFHAAVEEGWDEFANAVLAFFLFSQPIHFENRLYVDWRDLGAALRLAPTLKGYHRVERALQVAGAWICGDGQRHYDALCLAAWVPAGAPPVELPADFTGVTESPRKVIEKELIECIGPDTWLKLGTKAKQQLKEAELQWNKLHAEAGRGIDDWGSLATAYVKVIEGELGRRLSKVLMSDAFRNDHTRTKGRPPERHINLGTMLHLFKEFELRDQALKKLIIAENIRLQEDVALINDLLEVMHYRNRGAHPEGLSVDKFIKLRQLLFGEGVLKRFIELL